MVHGGRMLLCRLIKVSISEPVCQYNADSWALNVSSSYNIQFRQAYLLKPTYPHGHHQISVTYIFSHLYILYIQYIYIFLYLLFLNDVSVVCHTSSLENVQVHQTRTLTGQPLQLSNCQRQPGKRVQVYAFKFSHVQISPLARRGVMLDNVSFDCYHGSSCP